MDMKRDYYEDVQLLTSPVVIFWFAVLIGSLYLFPLFADNYYVYLEVKKVNETLARVENIRKFTILPKRLYEEDGEVTPTMKIKRKFVNKAFKDLIEGMY